MYCYQNSRLRTSDRWICWRGPNLVCRDRSIIRQIYIEFERFCFCKRPNYYLRLLTYCEESCLVQCKSKLLTFCCWSLPNPFTNNSRKVNTPMTLKVVRGPYLRWTFSSVKSVLFWHKWTISAPGIMIKINNPVATLMRNLHKSYN